MGIALRFVGLQAQVAPFIYLKGDKEDKNLPLEKSFSLLSWNICCIGGGYPISDGGVSPWSMRIKSVVEKVLEKNADVNCLYEVFDVQTAFTLFQAMKEKGYTHFYFNMGAKSIGTSSGIFVASKYKISHPEFIPFTEDMLVGRTKHSGKGAFSFDIESQGKTFATIVTTHMQHSELPEFPTDEEVLARKMQMELVLKKVEKAYDRCVVVTGDLNLDDHEYNRSFWKRYFEKGDAFSSLQKTWDGDLFCANLVGKKASGPLNLDHTMLRRGSARLIKTDLVKTGFDAKVFNKEALSDHCGLISQIHLMR
jgi:exonuclease III